MTSTASEIRRELAGVVVDMTEISTVIEETNHRRPQGHALRDAMLSRKGIHPNLDYPAGLAYHLMGFDIPAFTPLFVMSRITGWTAHISEQLAHNALIRPLAAYAGVDQRAVPSP